MLKYGVDSLLDRIGRVHPNLTIDRSDAIEWCFEAMEDCAVYEGLYESKGAALQAKGGIVALPKNIFRLLTVRQGCSDCAPMAYQLGNGCLRVGCSDQTVYVDMLLLPVDEDGGPLIDDTLFDVCQFYILKKKLYEPYLQGSLRPDAYKDVEDKYDSACARARASYRNLTNDQLDRMTRLVRSAVTVRRR